MKEVSKNSGNANEPNPEDVMDPQEKELLEKELQELIEEGQTRTEAYMKLIKEIEKRIEKRD
ncbi:MAG: hypothetical protein K9G46_05090 [Flavobacteriales bacterium]|jgi:hypothetical protein|nr:hypothetical protein [Flavobacteriales bacterium]